MKRFNTGCIILIVLLSCFFYIPSFDQVHLFDWDEINFAESAREMLLTKNFATVQINFKPFYEKPPMFFWMQAGAMSLFGVTEFAARFPNSVIGTITLVTLFFIGKTLRTNRFGLIWALIYWGSLTPHLYFKSGIIDPTFNLFIFLAIYFMIKVRNHPCNALVSGLFIGLAILTKGPVAGLLWGSTMLLYWAIYSKFKPIFSIRQFIVFAVVAGSVTSVWIMLQLEANGIGFFVDFFNYQIRLFTTPDAGHGQPFYYHFVVVLIGCFPMSVFCIPYLFKKQDEDFNRWMKILFWVVLILFSISTTKIVHYSSLAYFPVSYLAASFVFDWLEGKTNFSKPLRIVFFTIGIFLAVVMIALPVIGMNAAKIIPWIRDPFAAKNLEAQVNWSGFETGIGICYLLTFVGTGLFFKYILHRRSFKLIFLSIITSATALLLLLTSVFIVPKIERYTQGAAIDFYVDKQGEDIYIDVIGFKSYAQYFYFRKPFDPKSELHTTEWLLNGPVDKPVYLISKIDRMEEFRNNPNLEVLYEKNGFVFMRRK